MLQKEEEETNRKRKLIQWDRSDLILKDMSPFSLYLILIFRLSNLGQDATHTRWQELHISNFEHRAWFIKGH